MIDASVFLKAELTSGSHQLGHVRTESRLSLFPYLCVGFVHYSAYAIYFMW